MILSDIAIKAELDGGRLVITPPPAPEAISTAVVDLHLSNRLRIPKTGMSVAVQLDKPDVGMLQNQLYDEITIPPSGHNLDPGRFVLGFTSERITLPPHLAGWVEGRSTLARFGLTVHMTAPTVHPNWDGNLMLEMSVMGEWTCVLKPGLSIAQLRLAFVAQPNTATLQSVWQGQGPEH